MSSLLIYVGSLAVILSLSFLESIQWLAKLQIIWVFLPAWIEKKSLGEWLKEQIQWGQNNKKILLSGCLSFLIVILFHFFWNYVGVSFFQKGILQITWKISIIGWANILLFVFIEEVVFRGQVQSKLNQILKIDRNKEWGQWLVFFICSLLFSLFHFFRLGWGCFIIFLPSLYFCWLRSKSNSLLSPILAHFLFNIYYDLLAPPHPF